MGCRRSASAISKRVLEGAVDAAVILDQDHRVLYRNSAYDAYTGKRPREVGAAAAAGTPCHSCSTSRSAPTTASCGARWRRASRCAWTRSRAKRGDGEELTLDRHRRRRSASGLVRRDLSRRDGRVARAAQVPRAARARARREGGPRAQGRASAPRRCARAQDQLVLNEKMSSLGRLVAGIAHELNNPINFVYGNVDFLGALLPPAHQAWSRSTSRRRAARRSCAPRVEEHKHAIDFDFLCDDWERAAAAACAPAPSGPRRSSPASRRSRGRRSARSSETDLVAGHRDHAASCCSRCCATA